MKKVKKAPKKDLKDLYRWLAEERRKSHYFKDIFYYQIEYEEAMKKSKGLING